jgi:hypothetical protein
MAELRAFHYPLDYPCHMGLHITLHPVGSQRLGAIMAAQRFDTHRVNILISQLLKY